jgi:SAM-dependent methyltransferase
LKQATEKLKPYLLNGQYELQKGDITTEPPLSNPVDLGLSMMVMEHVENDVGFVQKIKQNIKPGGQVIIGVPGRRDHWCLEDETVGHFRRYDRNDLKQTLEKAGLKNVRVWSVAVPTANLLFSLGNFLVKHSGENKKKELPLQEQTKLSGIREIPFKTVFPSWFRLILNRYTLYPLFWLQRLFYHTNLGLTMIGFGEV